MFSKSIFFISLFFLVSCGSSSSDEGQVTNPIDFVDYYPSKNTSKSFLKTEQTKYDSTRDTYTQTIEISKNILRQSSSSQKEQTIIFSPEEIQETGDENKTMKRFVSLGDVLYSLEKKMALDKIMLGEILLGTKQKESTKECKLVEKLDKLELYGIPYEGDILKFKCIEDSKIVTKMEESIPDYITLRDSVIQNSYDISYFYMQKKIGLISIINEDCMISGGDFEIIDDRLPVCLHKDLNNDFFLN